MELQELQRNWDLFGKTDPLWAILTEETKRGGGWQPEEFFQTGAAEIDDLLATLLPLGLPRVHARALDFGCGVGRLTQALCRHFTQCYGIDIAPSMLELAEQYNRYGQQCCYILNQQPDLRLFEADFFDLIYSRIVLQHMQPVYSRSYIQEFVRTLAPGGMLVFQVPSEVTSLQVLPPAAFRVEILPPSLPTGVEAIANTATLAIQVKNTSTLPWQPENFLFLANHWLTLAGDCLSFCDSKAPLEQPLLPGETTRLWLKLQRPAGVNRAILVLDVMQESVGWFESQGNQTVKLVVQFPETAGEPWKILPCSQQLWMRLQLNQGWQRLRRRWHRWFGLPSTASSPPPEPAPVQSVVEAADPVMEMHCLPRAEVAQLVEQSGGQLLRVVRSFDCGLRFLSFTYYVTKEAGTSQPLDSTDSTEKPDQ